jgi:hypothetical protein
MGVIELGKPVHFDLRLYITQFRTSIPTINPVPNHPIHKAIGGQGKFMKGFWSVFKIISVVISPPIETVIAANKPKKQGFIFILTGFFNDHFPYQWLILDQKLAG